MRREKNGSFYPPHGCLEARYWSKHSTCVCVFKTVLQFCGSLCVLEAPRHLHQMLLRCVPYLCFLFCLNFKVGHRNRPEGGCLKTDDDDSFAPHVHVKNLNLCEQLSPRVMIFFVQQLRKIVENMLQHEFIFRVVCRTTVDRLLCWE